ncbi:MAG: hypothetical protein N4A74_23975, partial [Carboxylicivirga sp.]|nr:hypothetical protein [Carboxylicivirga sp.]
YLVPNGAFYGTKKACQPINAVYNYKDKNIYWVNDFNSDVSDHNLKVTVYDVKSKELYSDKVQLNMDAHSSGFALEIPKLKGLTDTYFINLEITDKSGDLVADNFYWLSTKADEMAFEKTTWVYTPPKDYANLQALNDLQKVDIKTSWNQRVEGKYTYFTCQLENSSSQIAFFIEARVIDRATNRMIVPVFWDDNYVSIMPNGTKVLTAKIETELLPDNLNFVVEGWNKN